MENKDSLIVAGFLALIGCLAVVLGCGAVVLIFAFQAPFVTRLTDAPASPPISNPAEEFTGEANEVAPSEWWSGEQANAACETLGEAFPTYRLRSAVGIPQLSCEYGSEALEGGSIAARIAVTGFPSPEAASQYWQNGFGPDSEFAKLWIQMQELGLTYAPEADRYFVTAIAGHAGKAAYKVQGGLLYRNAIVVFDENEAVDGTTATWERVQALARQLIDQVNAR